ncbi:MAG: RNA polymerase sporulation sigma factor SigH [Christensenellaceae bacterium]|nr:RNA polymerase sporulation sigma factor SigH [Christensenellaceae bacterium]
MPDLQTDDEFVTEEDIIPVDFEFDTNIQDIYWQKFKNLSDEQVVALAQQGDDYAFEYMIERFKPLVRNRARSYFLIGADQEDLIQEGTIGLFKAIRDFDHSKLVSFRGFADLCVVRQLITAIKTATRQKHGPLNSYISLNKPIYSEESDRSLIDVMVSNTSQNPEDMMISQENIKSLKKEVEKRLSPFEQKVLSLYLEGISYQEIAQALNKQSKSIDNALQRVKKKLEGSLKEIQ